MAPWNASNRKAQILPVGGRPQTATRKSRYTPITPEMFDETFMEGFLAEIVKRTVIRQSPDSGNWYPGTNPEINGGFYVGKNAQGDEISVRLSAALGTNAKLASEVRQAQSASLEAATPEQLRERLRQLTEEADQVAANE